MSASRIGAIILIYATLGVAWAVLGGSVYQRTSTSSRSLGAAVESLWGTEQRQSPPKAWCTWKEQIVVVERKGRRKVRTVIVTPHRNPLSLMSSDLTVKLHSEPRRKGLLWYRTYKVQFQGHYTFKHAHSKMHNAVVDFFFPASQALYDDFQFKVNGREQEQASELPEGVRQQTTLKPGEPLTVDVRYRSLAKDRWSYRFGDSATRVRNFNLKMETDFGDIDFPAGTLSPTQKTAAGKGWDLLWDYKSIISGLQIGMEMPEKLNPGPLAARMSLFAPVSLLFFFFLLFIIAVLRDLRLHPMHFLFLGCAFFSFHLLFAYLADHLLPFPSFLICSAVSIGLVVSYLRLVTGLRFAVVEAGLSQFVYLVLFSYAFFFEGFTGLTITIGAILSLSVVMQLTGKVNWEEKFAAAPPARTAAPAAPPTQGPKLPPVAGNESASGDAE